MKSVQITFLTDVNPHSGGPAQIQILTIEQLQQGGLANFEQIVLENARAFWARLGIPPG